MGKLLKVLEMYGVLNGYFGDWAGLTERRTSCAN